MAYNLMCRVIIIVLLFVFEIDRFSHNVADLSPVMRKPEFCICENKDVDQLRGKREADQCLCFRYTEGIIPLLPKSEI